MPCTAMGGVGRGAPCESQGNRVGGSEHVGKILGRALRGSEDAGMCNEDGYRDR